MFKVTAPFRKRAIERSMEVLAAASVADFEAARAQRNARIAEVAIRNVLAAMHEHRAALTAIAREAKASTSELERLEPIREET